jgi:nitroimidazol reductase NimA-like FMN-containing flavoprotein (pyridoxamine 5'-phosphate oxidase superfamily)
MTPDEVHAMVSTNRKVQIATRNPDGSTHLVTMFYVVLDGRIAFWTYRSSQKARNLARDPRITCLVETGDDYFELRGVQVRGVARSIDDPAAVADIGRRVSSTLFDLRRPKVQAPGRHGLTGVPAEFLDDYVAQAARKRIGFTVEPERIVSWDHRKLGVTSSRP